MVNPRLAVIVSAADYLSCLDRYPESDAKLSALLKTVDWYQRAMWKAVRDLYSGEIGSMEFETLMIDIIQNQLRRAWNEGMRSLGLDPEIDMLPEWEMKLQDIMLRELDYVGPMAQDVLTAKNNNEPVEQFRSRVDIWTTRYTDVVNQAVQTCSEMGQKLIWRFGATEQHCDTCSQLDGTVAYSSEWERAGLHPQSPPNELLQCGGWKCDCRLEPTDQRRSPNALDKLLAIGLG